MSRTRRYCSVTVLALAAMAGRVGSGTTITTTTTTVVRRVVRE